MRWLIYERIELLIREILSVKEFFRIDGESLISILNNN